MLLRLLNGHRNVRSGVVVLPQALVRVCRAQTRVIPRLSAAADGGEGRTGVGTHEVLLPPARLRPHLRLPQHLVLLLVQALLRGLALVGFVPVVLLVRSCRGERGVGSGWHRLQGPTAARCAPISASQNDSPVSGL